MKSMNRLLGAALALALMVASGWAMGWPGVLLALTAILFLLLLQFTQLMRTMRRMSAAPVGTTPSCVMLHARLHQGLPLLKVLELAGSLGEAHDGGYRWRDAAGDSLLLRFDAASKLQDWQLQRAS
jgi:hypothetical protein